MSAVIFNYDQFNNNGARPFSLITVSLYIFRTSLWTVFIVSSKLQQRQIFSFLLQVFFRVLVPVSLMAVIFAKRSRIFLFLFFVKTTAAETATRTWRNERSNEQNNGWARAFHNFGFNESALHQGKSERFTVSRPGSHFLRPSQHTPQFSQWHKFSPVFHRL